MAIDFETANGSAASVCQVGLAKVIDGELVDSTSWDVVPPTGLDDYHDGNVRIHGITATRAALGESWSESARRIEAYTGDLPLVAYNVAFDRDVFESANALTGIRTKPFEWVCALDDIARRFIVSNRLDLAAAASILGVGAFNHHDAGDDAKTAALVVVSLAERFGARSLAHLASIDPDPSDAIVADLPPKGRNRGYARDGSNVRVADMPKPNLEADSAHPLHGHSIVITGDLKGHSKTEAWERIAAVGGTPHKGVRKDTTIIVVGEIGSITPTFDPGIGTGKVKKAAEYLAKGQPIRFMAGPEFLAYLDPDHRCPLPPVRDISRALPASEPTLVAEPEPAPEVPTGPEPASVPEPERTPELTTSMPTPRNQQSPARMLAPSMAVETPTVVAESVGISRRRPRLPLWVLWTVAVLAGLWSLLFIAAGVGLMVEGNTSAGIGGLIIFVAPAAVVLYFVSRAIRRRNQTNRNR